MQTQYEKLTDPQWKIIKEKLPVQRKRKYNLREIADAIFWILRTGSQWRNLVYYYFSKWKKGGTLAGLNTHLNMLVREREGHEPTPSAASIDSQSIKKAPFVSEDMGIDGNKKINGRKRHLLTDTLGQVWADSGTWGKPARRGHVPARGGTHVGLSPPPGEGLCRCGIQSGDWLRDMCTGIELEISSRPPASRGFVPVKIRWVTEQTFGVFNFHRRLDKDHEKTTNSAEAWIYWANCNRIINRLKT